MIHDPVADRYASALLAVCQRDGCVDEAAQQLDEIAQRVRDHADLRQFLLNPDVETDDKLAVLERLCSAWLPALRALVQLVLSWGRAEHLVDIADAFRTLVDAEQSLVRVTVRTAHPLTDAQRASLTRVLERQERRRIVLTEETAPELIGGLQIFLDHRILDGSISTQLNRLQQRLKAVRV